MGMGIPDNEPWRQEMPHAVAIGTTLGFPNLIQQGLDPSILSLMSYENGYCSDLLWSTVALVNQS